MHFIDLFTLFDKHPNVISWSSETISIPYFDPTKPPKGKWTVYIPDLLVVVDNGKGERHVELVEIKPLSQTPGHQPGLTKSGRARKPSKYEQLEQIRNQAKWTAALAYCAKRGWKFTVMTEKTIFGHRK